MDQGPILVHQYPHAMPGDLPFLPELMIPDQVHKREDDFTLFLLYRNETTGEFQYLYDRKYCEESPYFLYTLVTNMKDDTLYKRGSLIKSLSIVTKLSFFKNFKPLMLICLDKYFKDNNLLTIKELYELINVKNLSLGINKLSMVRKLLVTSILDLPIQDKIYYDEKFRNKILGLKYIINTDLFIRKDLSFNSIIKFQNMKIPIRIPMIQLPDNIGDYYNPTDLNFKPNLINILNAKISPKKMVYNNELTIYGMQTPPIIILINALLTGKRILFLSYENSSGYIIDHILLALKIITGGGILTGFLTHYNLFPMIDVSKIEILEKCESYIAGTINPFFKNNDKLWDLLYDLDSNEILFASHLDQPELSPNNPNNAALASGFRNSIISEDAKFLSNLQLSLFNYNDDLTTIQLIFRRHINEIIRILLSSKNFSFTLPTSPIIGGLSGSTLSQHQSPQQQQVLLLEGVGYQWTSDMNKLLEVSCYQSIQKKFQNLLGEGKLNYSLMLPNLRNELNLMIDLQYHLQGLQNSSKPNEREIWFNILKYLISGKSLEIFLLVTYLIPPNSSTSLQSSSMHGGNLTIFDKNKGIELLLLNLFNRDDQIKSNVIMILQELQDNYLCGWCLDNFIKNNVIYEMAFNELINK